MDFWTGFWDELRPRFLTFRLAAGRVRLRWAVPLWAIEEPLVFAAKASPLAVPLVRRLRRRPLAGPLPLLPVLRALLSEDGKRLLRLPPGEVYFSVRTKGAEIEIGQL